MPDELLQDDGLTAQLSLKGRSTIVEVNVSADTAVQESSL